MATNKTTTTKTKLVKPTTAGLLKMNREDLNDNLKDLPFADLSDLLGKTRTNIEQNTYLFKILEKVIKETYPEYSLNITSNSYTPINNYRSAPNMQVKTDDNIMNTLYDNRREISIINTPDGESYIAPENIILDVPNS
jgi:hypothetical protein